MRLLPEAAAARDEHWTVRGAGLPAGASLREKLLLIRGLPVGAERDLFLHPAPHRSLGTLLGDPLTLPDAEPAVARLSAAIAAGESVCVYGDYDADGVTATAILVRGLRQLGGRVEYYIPHRVEEGFGLNERAVRAIAARRVGLVVTVDCGTADGEEIALARRLGVDVIVTDHHALPPELPDAVAVVNPKRADGAYPDRRLTGAGIAYAVLRALVYRLGAAARMRAGELVQLAALGTIADVAPLLGENRLLVRAGLAMMNAAPLPGVRALMSASGLAGATITEGDVSYKLAPRLNAAGRMEHANLACELLLAADSLTARRLAGELERLNDDRRLTSDGMLAVAADMVDSGAAYGGDVLTVYHDDWSPALLGIVAGRLSRLHGVPVVAATRDGEGVRASARSVPDLDICAALDACRELLTEHGGHAQAAGFGTSLTGLRDVHQHLLTVFAGTRRTRLPEVDLELEPDALGPALGADLEALSPFGAGNAEPVFGLRGVRPRGVRVFGKQRTHLGFTLPGGRGLDVEVIGWGMAGRREELAVAPSLDLSVRALRQQSGSYAPLRLVVEHAWPRPR